MITSYFYYFFSKLLSRLTRFITHITIPRPLRNPLFNQFCKIFNVNQQEIENPLDEYENFDAFFTRRLKVFSRTINKEAQSVVSPVDGVIQEHGKLLNTKLLQAKGVYYTLEALLPTQDITPFINGYFYTFYLSPRDCHRIFSPVNGEIVGWEHVPGKLYPVRQPYIAEFHNLYTKNERLSTFIQTEFGPVAVVKVGAFNVGTMSLPYDESILTNHMFQKVTSKTLEDSVNVSKGDHIGTFHLGSTIVLIFPKNTIQPCQFRKQIKYGEKIGTIL